MRVNTQINHYGSISLVIAKVNMAHLYSEFFEDWRKSSNLRTATNVGTRYSSMSYFTASFSRSDLKGRKVFNVENRVDFRAQFLQEKEGVFRNKTFHRSTSPPTLPPT